MPLNSEDFYSVTITTKDNEDTTHHTLPKIVRFTSAGPVVIDSINDFTATVMVFASDPKKS